MLGDRLRWDLVEEGGVKHEAKKRFSKLALEMGEEEVSDPEERSTGIRDFFGASLWKDFQKSLGEPSFLVRESKKRRRAARSAVVV